MIHKRYKPGQGNESSVGNWREERHDHRPTVTIGLPVFNGEDFLAEAVQSLLSQSFEDIELIVSDNCSTDGTADICKGFASADARVRYFRQNENIGGLANFEFVYRQSTGRYYMWAAHDDIWSPTWVEKLLARIEGLPNACAYGRPLHVDEVGEPVPHIANNRAFGYEASLAFARRIKFFMEPEALGKANVIYGLFPREAIEKFLPVALRRYRYLDCVMLWCLLARYRMLSVDYVFLYKRIHVGAASGGARVASPELGWRAKIMRLYFMIGTNLSFRGNSDYFRADPGLTALACVLLVPVKMWWAIFKIRAAVRDNSLVKYAND